MATLIDLSGPLYPGMWSYNQMPGSAGRFQDFEAHRAAAIETDGFEIFSLAMCTITGTYLETGAHVISGMPVLSDLALGDFIRPAVVCHLPHKAAGELVRRAELEAHCPPVEPGDALLIECGWGARWDSPDFVSGTPSYHIDCLPWLLAQPFGLLGVDVPRLQTEKSIPAGEDSNQHMLSPIFRRGALLLAPLVNLDRIAVERGELIALPLNVRGINGVPCRAVFRPL